MNDLYQPLSPARATKAVLVNPVAPTGVVIAPSVGSISEGQSISLAGSFVAPGPGDHHVVSIDWGDGSRPTTVPWRPGVTSFAGVGHTYAGNSLGQAGGAFPITATVIDPARPTGSGVGTTSVIVRDVASTVSNLAATFVGGGAIPIVGTDPRVNAGTTVRLTGSYTTPNPDDTYSLLISWGDGTASTVPTAYVASHTFVASHIFADRATGVVLDDIHVTVTDTEHTTGSGDLTLAVAHVDPVAAIASGGISGSGNQMLSAQTSGGDASPIASYAWTVSALDGSSPQTFNTATVALPSTPKTDYLVRSAVTDSLGAVSNTFKAVVHVLDDTSSTYQIPDPGPGVNAVLVSGLSGDHVIDGRATSVPIVFDGDGKETFIGNAADDVFNLHTDGSKATGNGGNNVFNLTPNCTLYAVANGGQNTLNFSSSTFGVTFDLTQTQGQMQVVAPGTDAQGHPHVVSADATGGGAFSTLVGTSKNDAITAASDTTISGGGGMDTITAASSSTQSVKNLTIKGGGSADSGVFVNTSGPSVGDINFQGDGGTDLLTNTGTITGSVLFSGGSDAGTFNNMGTIDGTIVFNGGADGELTNTGTVTGTVTYGAGSDANTLSNAAGAILGTVIFNGDEGVNTFLNEGTVGAITYSGGSDADSLVNSAGGTVGTIVFNAGEDAGTLTNEGMVTGSVTYNGGSDAGDLVNAGTIVGTVTYGGGSDADVFTNATGASVGSIVFTGGSDAGTLTNDGMVTGTVVYNGGSDADTILNNGTIVGTVTYGGGSDADVFTNAAGAPRSARSSTPAARTPARSRTTAWSPARSCSPAARTPNRAGTRARGRTRGR